ncbi:carboxymuconolactone decarboxylase family protein [Paraburkholderia sp. BCC1885]|uniref:carboxymuconolactone decarboxylase family protein n=1 Tax=Paraburkholderia sp. BCC1885 TaxID=2562669 RepID=UPI001642532C
MRRLFDRVHDALQSGATGEEILEAVDVAAMMGGGPTIMYSCGVYEAHEHFEVCDSTRYCRTLR